MSEHKGSRETYDHIAQWVNPYFFFSERDEWGRFGFLGVFADFVLACTPGAVAEIGVGESSIYLGAVARKYHRRIYHCDISASKIENPMTIPGYLGEDRVFIRSRETHRPYPQTVLFAGSSDEFFNEMAFADPFAISFIDGDHNYAQVKKDFENIVQHTVENGYIILHDTHPLSEDYIHENACGDVYKLRQEIEADPRFDCLTLPKGCAIDVGFTIVRKLPKERKYFQ